VALTLAILHLKTAQFLEFLRRELAPTPGRWSATLRLTLACVACTIPVMMFHLKEPLLVMILMFFIVKEDKTSTLLGTIMGIIGATVGCGLLLAYFLCALELTWLRIIGIPVFIAVGLLLNRIVTLAPLGLVISIPMAMGMIVPDVVPYPEFLNRFPFHLWWAIVLGLGVNLAVQLLLNPNSAESLVIRDLTARLDAVEQMLRQRAAGKRTAAPESTLAQLALSGVAEQMQYLKLATLAKPRNRRHPDAARGQIILVDRLVTAAAVLEIQGAVPFSDAQRARLQRLADACTRWRTAIRNRRPPEFSSPSNDLAAASTDHAALPSLAEMERVVALMPQAFPGRELPAELKPGAGQAQSSFLVPGALKNRDYQRFALKGALAGLICYLIFSLTDYREIYTSVITCIVCSLSTLGAGVQKGLLRFAGAAVGGVLGILTLVYVFPQLDSLGGFWFPFAAVTALAAYVNFGSTRIAYCGIQIGLAFYKCVLQDYGPSTGLHVVGERLIGIALGLTVFGLINRHLWPETALETTSAKLASALRLLAKLASLPDEGKNPAPHLAEASDLRWQVYRELSAVRQLLESSKFESDAARRENQEAISRLTQAVFLCLLAVIQHRTDLRPAAVPETLRAASVHFRTTLADMLTQLSARVEGRAGCPLSDLSAALQTLEQTVATQLKTVPDASLVNQIQARLALYQQTVQLTLEMARLPSSKSRP
jgi:multidrug resistance protein MdtO